MTDNNTKTERSLNAEIGRLALPNILSNIAVPLLGMADVAIAGYIGGDATIGAIGIGSTMFNMIYWNCGFLRMGASGMTAQAFGAKDYSLSKLILLRSLIVALTLSLFLLLLKTPVCALSMDIIGGEAISNAEVSTYIGIRYFAIPASISLFAISGWFIGMQDSVSPMFIAIGSNIVNIALSAFFAIGCQMGIAGVALGTVAAQYCGIAAAGIIYRRKYSRRMPHVAGSAIFDAGELKRFASVNTNIFLRTLCIVIAFTAFTSLSSREGATVLAANTLMLQLQTLFSYMIDGLAYAAESLVGRFVGARAKDRLRQSISRLTLYGFFCALATAMIYVVSWNGILNFFSPSGEAMRYAGEHIGWIIALPLVSFYAFVADGIMIGATESRIMRNNVALSLLLAAAAVFLSRPWAGAESVWVGMLCFMAMRSALMVNKVRRLLD